MEGRTMYFWKTLLLLNSGQAAGQGPTDNNVVPGFPTGHLMSSAWEGWWHDEVPLPLAMCKPKEPILRPQLIARNTRQSWNHH